jgi:CubicO group peptidase (beta-lactamase class C family)
VLRGILDEGVASGAAPGGVLLVADAGAVTHRIAFGSTSRVPPGSARRVDPGAVYDLASVTKPTATVASLMKLVAAGTMALDDAVRRWIPELTVEGSASLRLRDLLCHASGLPAHQKYYERVLAGETCGAASPREAILRMVCETPLEYEPRSRSVYSDLGFILLGFAVERAAGDRLDHVARRLVFDPVGMPSARFVDLAQPDRPDAPPTEDCPYRGIVRGEVHDQNTHAAGGILGQAGLFACADDLGRFADAMIRASAGFDRAVLDAFFAPCGVPGSTWRHGWDTPSTTPGESQAGERWSRAGFGHTGFTGTSMWLDPPRGRYAILLTNSIHPVVQKPVTKAFRRRVMDAIVAELEGA